MSLINVASDAFVICRYNPATEVLRLVEGPGGTFELRNHAKGLFSKICQFLGISGYSEKSIQKHLQNLKGKQISNLTRKKIETLLQPKPDRETRAFLNAF